MTSPVKDANSDRMKMKAAQKDVWDTHRKTVTFDVVDGPDGQRIRISGSAKCCKLISDLSNAELQAKTLPEFFNDMLTLNHNGVPSYEFVQDLQYIDVGKDTGHMSDDEFVAFFSYPRMPWPKVSVDPSSDHFTLKIGRDSCQLYQNFLGYGKGGKKSFTETPRPNWWPDAVAYGCGSKFNRAEVDMFMKQIITLFNIPPDHHEGDGNPNQIRRLENIADDANIED